MAQNSFTVSRGATNKSDVTIASDATSFTGDVRLIIKDTATKAEIYKLIELL